MNFSLYFDSSDGVPAYNFNFVDGKMVSAAGLDAYKHDDLNSMRILLRAAKESGLPSRIVIDG